MLPINLGRDGLGTLIDTSLPHYTETVTTFLQLASQILSKSDLSSKQATMNLNWTCQGFNLVFQSNVQRCRTGKAATSTFSSVELTLRSKYDIIKQASDVAGEHPNLRTIKLDLGNGQQPDDITVLLFRQFRLLMLNATGSDN